jgi:hypothetical protein
VIAKLEEKVIVTGYVEGKWYITMLRDYGEDYEDMTERVRQCAEESEWGNTIMDITKEISVLPHHGVSQTDPVSVGDTQTMLERDLKQYFKFQ